PAIICQSPPCPFGSSCTQNTDCITGYCQDGLCAIDIAVAIPHTLDGTKPLTFGSGGNGGNGGSSGSTGSSSGSSGGGSGSGGSTGGSSGDSSGASPNVPFMDWPMWDTDTGNEPCAQDIGYQMTSQNENGGNNLVTSGNGIAYCTALSDVGVNGCTIGVDGGGGALLVWAYYSVFNGTSDALRKYYIPGSTIKLQGSKLSKSFCTGFCADFKKAAQDDPDRMLKAQAYGNAILNGLPTKQIAAKLHLKLPLSFAAVYPGVNVQIDLTETSSHDGIEAIIKKAGPSPADGADEEVWLKNFLTARANILNANSLWAQSQPARMDMYIGVLEGGSLPKEKQNYVKNVNLIPPVLSNGVANSDHGGPGDPITYTCYGSGVPAKST
ncbi:hypothetical protein HDU76_005456, partial [Blyttiomyces sp. JEL0837]